MELTDKQVRYLERTLRRLETEKQKDKAPLISIAARREAAILLLLLNGYKWDHERLEATKS